jgi:hypothetical protein
MSKNTDNESNELDGQKNDVGDLGTGIGSTLPAIKPQKLPKRNFQSHPAKHGLWVNFDKRPVDGRTKLAKYMGLLRASLIKDLGGDPSTMQAVLIDRVVHKVTKCFLYERGVLSENNQGSRDLYLALCNSLRLDLCALGLKRRARKIMNLDEYLREKEQREDID